MQRQNQYHSRFTAIVIDALDNDHALLKDARAALEEDEEGLALSFGDWLALEGLEGELIAESLERVNWRDVADYIQTSTSL